MEVSQWHQFQMGKRASLSPFNLISEAAHFSLPLHGKNPKKILPFELMAVSKSKYTGQSVKNQFLLQKDFFSISLLRFLTILCAKFAEMKRTIPMRILTVGKKRSQGLQLLVKEYMEKIKYYCSIEDVHLKPNPRNSSNIKTQIEDEDMSVIKQIKPDDWVVMLDEHGIDVGSEKMADLLGEAGITGSTRLCFCIGGPYGHGPQVRERADITIKLSSMVLNHQIALLVLLEQLYRSWTIIRGQKYHH